MNKIIPLEMEATISRAPGAVQTDLHGTLLIAAGYGEQGHCMDPAGLAIWEYLAEPCTIAGLCERLCARYEVEPTECEHDVMEFIIDLLGKKLIVVAGQTSLQ